MVVMVLVVDSVDETTLLLIFAFSMLALDLPLKLVLMELVVDLGVTILFTEALAFIFSCMFNPS